MYRPRNPRASPLFQLFETHYETVKSVWEERFERHYAKVAIMRSLLAEPGSWGGPATFNYA